MLNKIIETDEMIIEIMQVLFLYFMPPAAKEMLKAANTKIYMANGQDA